MKKEKLKEIESKALEIYRKIGYERLTKIQERALPVIVRRRHTLLIAPTGSGKTEAAIIPIFSSIEKGALRVLYITPLRSLNRDILRRIKYYGELLGLNVAVRHGDTNVKERKKIIENPPEVLITTPESLSIILTNEKMIQALKHVEWVVIDEIHELLGSERGSHLSLSLERLDEIANKPVRVGLSATIGNIEEAARFLMCKDKCAVLIDDTLRRYDIEIIYREGATEDIKFISEYLKHTNANSILIFTNTRDEAEYLSTVLKHYTNMDIDVHHGSLSKSVREETEQRLRSGDAKVVVATSSLELGLDIGYIDLVIHHGSPRQVSKLAQRIGRSKHKVDHSAKGLIVTNNKDEELEAKAIVERLKHGSIEKQEIHRLALDVLAHHLVGLALVNDKVEIDYAYKIFSRAYPFKSLNLEHIISCLDILQRNSIVKVEGGYYRKGRNSKKYYFENISTIPDILKFDVVDSITNKTIGMLDQEFIGDYGEKGNVFVLKGLQWRILAIDDRRLKVMVEPVKNSLIKIPYWVGEMIPVDYKTAIMVGMFRDKSYSINGIIPNHRRLVIEASRDGNRIVIHACLGNKINNTLAALLSTLISSKTGYIVEAKADAYRIALTSNAKIVKYVKDCLIEDYEIEPIIIASLTNTHNLNWKVWLVSKRFGLIERDSVYDKKVARMIYERYAKTAVVKEAIRELLHEKFDILNTANILKRIREGELEIVIIEVDQFSDVARSILEHSKGVLGNPVNIEQGIIELVRERLEKSKHKLICIRCGKWENIVEVREAPEKLSCKLCNSRLITSTYVNDEDLVKIIRKRLNGLKLNEEEERKFIKAWKCSSLIYNFGKKALIVLAGYGVGVDTAARILRNCVDDSSLYKMVYEAEKQYITTRGFWDE